MHLVSTALVAAVALVPLLVLPGVFFHFDVTPKAVTLLLCAAAALIVYRPAASRELRLLRLIIALQAASLLLSTVFSTDPALSISGTNWRRFGLATQLALLVFLEIPIPLARLLRTIVVSGSLAAAYGIAQYFGWDPLLPKEGYHVGEGVWMIVRPPGTLGHAGYFGVYLLHVTFAGAALASGDKDPRWRWVGAAAMMLGAAAVVFSGARAAILGLVVGALALAVRRRATIRRAHAALAGVALVAMAAFYLSPAGLRVRSRVRWFREDPAGGGRVTVWLDTVRMSLPRLLTGYGLETFSSQYPRFQSESLARRFPDRYFESPHNVFLDALAAQGLLGLLALTLAAAAGLWMLRSADILFAGLVAALVGNQFVSFTIPTALLFYVMVRAGFPAVPPAQPARWPKLASVAFIGVAGSLAWSDFWLLRARKALEAGDAERGAGTYGRMKRLAMPGLDADLWYSRALLASEPQNPAVWQQAFLAALRASERSEQRPNAYYNLAAFYASQNDFSRTEQSLRSAIEWAPQWYKPRWMLAQVLEQAGRLREAEAEARRALELSGGQHTEVSETWRRITEQQK